jgi:hypothetical protein
MQTRPLVIRVRAIRHGHPFWRRPALSPRLIIRPLPGPRLGPPVPLRNPGGPERGFLGTGTVNVRGWQTIHHHAGGPQVLLAQGQTANRETVKPPCPASGRFCERTPHKSPNGIDCRHPRRLRANLGVWAWHEIENALAPHQGAGATGHLLFFDARARPT